MKDGRNHLISVCGKTFQIALIAVSKSTRIPFGSLTLLFLTTLLTVAKNCSHIISALDGNSGELRVEKHRRELHDWAEHELYIFEKISDGKAWRDHPKPLTRVSKHVYPITSSKYERTANIHYTTIKSKALSSVPVIWYSWGNTGTSSFLGRFG